MLLFNYKINVFDLPTVKLVEVCVSANAHTYFFVLKIEQTAKSTLSTYVCLQLIVSTFFINTKFSVPKSIKFLKKPKS